MTSSRSRAWDGGCVLCRIFTASSTTPGYRFAWKRSERSPYSVYVPSHPGSSVDVVKIEANGQKQSPPVGETPSAEPPAAVSEASVAKVSDLLAASAQAAQVISERAKVDGDALTRAATQAAVVHSREQLSQLETSVSQLSELVEELRAEVDELRMELVGEARPSPPSDPASFPPQLDRRALLIVLNMAGNGASRSETADYLAENLGLRDCDGLLDAVYDYVAATRPSPRETKPGS
jgi:hypothetical protein